MINRVPWCFDLLSFTDLSTYSIFFLSICMEIYATCCFMLMCVSVMDTIKTDIFLRFVIYSSHIKGSTLVMFFYLVSSLTSFCHLLLCFFVLLLWSFLLYRKIWCNMVKYQWRLNSCPRYHLSDPTLKSTEIKLWNPTFWNTEFKVW